MYLPLYIKTDYSILGSMVKIDDLIETAKNLSIKALTITDNNMSGVMEFYLKCTKNNIKPIIGLEVNYKKKIVLYAKNNNGYHNLIKISSNQITLETLKIYKDDLICIIPYNSYDLYDELQNVFLDIFVGYANKNEFTNIKEKKIYLEEILSIKKEDNKYLRYLLAIKNNTNLDKIIINNDNYLKDETTYSILDYNKENNLYVLNSCNVNLTKNNLYIPTFSNKDSFSNLKELCLEGMKNKFGDKISKKYQERLKYELDTINKMGFCDYFLIVQDYINYAKRNNILVGPSRGSVGGSLVAYVLNITNVDPIKYNLIFERFLNKDRVTMPDIDIDFEFNKRDEVVKYCTEKYGNKKVAGIITFGTMGYKQAIRDIGRITEIPIYKIESLIKAVDQKNKNLNQLLEDDEINSLYKASNAIIGIKRNTSIHAAGIVMSSVDLDEIIPLYNKNENYITAYTMDYLEDLGLLKMDFLALKTLSIIKDIVSLTKSDLDFENVDFNDLATFDLFKKGNTHGIFQFESNGIIDFIKKFKPNSLEDLFACIALYRPGPMDNIDSYIKRREGKEKIDYIIPVLENILSSTYGIIVYQEQIMEIASVIASYTYGEADILRRAISKKKEDALLNECNKFVEKSIKNGYSKEDATKIFNLILKFASYGFNRAHSVGYAMISYKMAYLKSNYTKEFYIAILNNSSGEDIKNYIKDAIKNNIKIEKPNINHSNSVFNIKNNSILLPFNMIKGLNGKVIDEIIKHKEYKDIFDFIKKVDLKIINKQILEIIIKAGCFNCFEYNKKTLIDNLDLIINYGELSLVENNESLLPILEKEEEYTKEELTNFEYDCYGFYLMNHPVVIHKLKYKNIIDLKDIALYFDKQVDLIVYIERINETNTKKNEKMCFITGSDEYIEVDLVIFPKNYIINDLKKGDILLIRGNVEKRFDKYQIIVSNYKKIL